jgi:hypothetical protein
LEIGKSLGSPKPEQSFWPFFAAAVVLTIILATIRWSLAHPYGIHWDEEKYLDEAGIDLQRLLSGHVLKVGGRILMKSWGIPPAYRILALPFLALFGYHATAARLVSMACFALSAWFIYLAARLIDGKVAGAIAVLIFTLSPDVVSASMFFGTDAPLYLATSAMLYYLFAFWSESTERPGNWIGLGLAVGLGFMSKTSFALIALPVLAFALVVRHYKYSGVPSLAVQLKAAGLASLIAGPWWLLNVKDALAYAAYARGFVRNSLGPPSPATWMHWLNTVIQCLLGHGLSIFIALVLIAAIRIAILKRETFLNPLQRTALGACACAGTPIVLMQLSGTNHLLRHISPAVIPLAIAIGVLSVQTGWIGSKIPTAIAIALFSAQLVMIICPVIVPNTHEVHSSFVNGSPPWQVMVRFDQWDWQPLRDVSDSCGLEAPKISFLGGGPELNPPQLAYPWVLHGVSVDHAAVARPEVTWLWRYEEGPLDWEKVMNSAEQSDIVFTAPHFQGESTYKDDLDNRHNAEFEERLSHDPSFRGPVLMQVGRFQPVEIDIFLKNTLVCRPGQQAAAEGKSK